MSARTQALREYVLAKLALGLSPDEAKTITEFFDCERAVLQSRISHQRDALKALERECRRLWHANIEQRMQLRAEAQKLTPKDVAAIRAQARRDALLEAVRACREVSAAAKQSIQDARARGADACVDLLGKLIEVPT